MEALVCLLLLIASSSGNLIGGYHDDVEFSPPVPEFPGIDPVLVQAALANAPVSSIEPSASFASAGASPEGYVSPPSESPFPPPGSPSSESSPSSAPPPPPPPDTDHLPHHGHTVHEISAFPPVVPYTPSETLQPFPEVFAPPTGPYFPAPPAISAPHSTYGPPGYSPPPVLSPEDKGDGVRGRYRLRDAAVVLESSPADGKYKLRIYTPNGFTRRNSGASRAPIRPYYPYAQLYDKYIIINA